jgi:hypothetical protein
LFETLLLLLSLNPTKKTPECSTIQGWILPAMVCPQVTQTSGQKLMGAQEVSGLLHQIQVAISGTALQYLNCAVAKGLMPRSGLIVCPEIPHNFILELMFCK